MHPIDVTRDIPVQVRENLERLFKALTANDEVPRVLFAEAEHRRGGPRAPWLLPRGDIVRLATALATGRALGFVGEGDPMVLARLVLGMIREPVFQAWLYGEELDAQAVVDLMASVMRDGVLRR